MKLATYKDGSRDGQLVVVSRDLAQAHYANGIATRLQQVLDDWNFLSPQLEDLYTTLNHGKARHAFAFDPAMCMAPLPRAYQWVGGSAYRHPAERVGHASGAQTPSAPPADPGQSLGAAAHGGGVTGEPLVYQGRSDDFLGPCDDAHFSSADGGIDFEAQLAVVTGDIAMGATPAQALEGIRLLVLANDWTLRHLVAAERAQGFGLFQSKPAAAFSPVAVTPDELGEAWAGGRVHLTLQSTWNGRTLGLVEAGPEMRFHFGQLIAHIAKGRTLRAGSIVGSGAVSNQDRSKGFSCIAEKRAIEAHEQGAPQTAFMQFGDTIRIEMKGRDGHSVFGAIEQTVVEAAA